MPSIDFAQLKELVPIQSVLELIGFVAAERHSDQVRGPCPLHGSSSPSSRSFSVNLRKNTFQCFRCHAAGNQLDLWAMAQKLPIYEASIDLCQRLGIQVPIMHSRNVFHSRAEKRNP